jgi:UDP-sugar transporter A1/2/3
MIMNVHAVLSLLDSFSHRLISVLVSFSANSTRLVLKRKLSNLQWMAIVLLAVGTTASQVC